MGFCSHIVRKNVLVLTTRVSLFLFLKDSDDEYVDVPGRPNLNRLPKQISSSLKKDQFREVEIKHLQEIMNASDFKKATGTTREGRFKLSDNGKIMRVFWQLNRKNEAKKPVNSLKSNPHYSWFSFNS